MSAKFDIHAAGVADFLEDSHHWREVDFAITESQVLVNPTPLVFFVDPAVAYNAVAIDATVFTSGLTAGAALDTIELIGPASAVSRRIFFNRRRLSPTVGREPPTVSSRAH